MMGKFLRALMTCMFRLWPGPKRFSCAQDAATLERVTGDSLAMMEEAVYATGFLDFPVSLVAAGMLVSARRAAGAWPFWPAALALLTGAAPAQGFL